MKVIIGLGNPGLEYRETRHNVGFLFLDYLKEIFQFEDFKDSRFRGIISEGLINGEKIILLKPITYMNLSGESAISLINFYKLDYKSDIIVVFDDMSMEFGKLRFRDKGSSGGHNGIKSFIKNFGDETFYRLKIGIGQDLRYNVSDWVLSRFNKEELEALNKDIFPQAKDIIENKFIS